MTFSSASSGINIVHLENQHYNVFMICLLMVLSRVEFLLLKRLNVDKGYCLMMSMKETKIYHQNNSSSLFQIHFNTL